MLTIELSQYFWQNFLITMFSIIFPNSCLHQLAWWSKTLVLPNPSHVLKEFPVFDLYIWVNTSTSLGIGLYVGSCWAAWMVLGGWDRDS